MLRDMLAGSWAVLTRPSVESFEAHEKNEFGWGALYAGLAALVAAALAGLGFWAAGEYGPTSQLPAATTPLGGAGTWAAAAMLAFLVTMVFFIAFAGLLYVLGRGQGGEGELGELTYDVALYWAPLAVVRAVLNQLDALGWSLLSSALQIAVLLYSLYLAWLAIQAGMNLDRRSAGGVIVALFALIAAVIVCGALAVFGIQILLGGNTG